MNEAGQRGREEIALGTGATRAPLPALRAGFLLDAATVARLGEPCAPGVDQDDGPASTHSQAGQPLDKHARRAALDRLPVGLLPRPIGELFQVKGAPQPQHPMGQLPVTALAGGRELAVEFAPPGQHLALAFGHLPALRASLDPAPLVVVGRVVGPTLPVELPVQPTQRVRREPPRDRTPGGSLSARTPPRWPRDPDPARRPRCPGGAAASGTASPRTPAGRRSGSAPRACGGPGART